MQKKPYRLIEIVLPIVNLIGSIFAKTGLSPNFFTLSGLVFCIASCAYLLYSKNIFVFCFLIVFSCAFDFIDGVVARVNNQQTKFGSYLDALCDRYFDGMVGVTVAYATGHWILISVLLLNAMNISYAKARAAIEVPVRNDEWPDLMQRAERNLIFLLGLLINELFPVLFFNRDLFTWTLILLNCAVLFTVIQRIHRARSIIESRANLS